MNIENQVCTWEQGLQLKRLGVKADSYFTWMEAKLTKDGDNFISWWAVFRPNNGEYDYMTDMISPEGHDDPDFETDKECAAYTVAELAELIGRGTKAAENHWQWLTDCVNAGCSGTVCYDPVALAGFVITQIESGVITAEEVNNRLK